MSETHAAEFTCRACGAVAGRVEVRPAEASPGNQLVVSVFTSLVEQSSYGETYARAAAAIDAGDAAALYRMDFQWAPFYCPGCDACYCSAHWSQRIDFDGDFYDCTWGTCPAGHTRKLDD